MSTNVIQISENRAVYTVMEVAGLLALSRGTTYAMVRKGEIPAKKIGDRWVIPKTRFHAWLNDLPEATDEEIEREFRVIDRRAERKLRRASGDEGVSN